MTRRNILPIVWLVTSFGAGWLLWQGQSVARSPMAVTIIVALLFYLTVALIGWLPKPSFDDSSDSTHTRTFLFVVVCVVIAAILVCAYVVAGDNLLFALPFIGLVVLVLLRQVTKREMLYALGLGVIAGVAGLAAGISFISPMVWAMLQFLLVATGLPAGWSMLRYSGLLQIGIGRSRFLLGGTISALLGFVQGVALGIPWALSAAVLGLGTTGSWVQAWWQPVTALQPAIAEESWGRMLLVPLVFLLLRQVTRPQVALTTAIVIVGYWFAYLHTSSVLDVFIILLLGTLTVLPLAYLCLYRDVETAIGFHFAFDFIPAVIAFLLIRG